MKVVLPAELTDGFCGMTALGEQDALSKIVEDVRLNGDQAVCSPTSCQGTVRAAILVAARIAGVSEIHRLGDGLSRSTWSLP